ncbi:unnamed protein product [Owenia fusiformis]|uniref:Shisa N-terminal domain-containing protein n=1 Tax=Owenia fusiformis TaxID=6347 RepID=A0A8J1TEG6_OWEFU|nr:unnamed protein product [Owenia fusiformis]
MTMTRDVIYRISVLLICCVELARGLEYCTSYCDRRGTWQSGFVCGMFIRPPVAPKGTVAFKGTNTTLYCCGSKTFRFCCNDPDSSIAGLYPERYHCVRNMSNRWRIVLGVFTAVIILLTCGMCCFFGCSKTQFSATRSRTMPHCTRHDTNNISTSNRLANGGFAEHEEIILSAGPVPDFNYPIYQPPAYHEIALDPPPFTEQSPTTQITPYSTSTTVRVSQNAGVSGLVVALDTIPNDSIVNTPANENQTTTQTIERVTTVSSTTTSLIPNTNGAVNRGVDPEQTNYANACALPLPVMANETENVSTRPTASANALMSEVASVSNTKQQSNDISSNLLQDSSTVKNSTNMVNQARTTTVVNHKDNTNHSSSLSQTVEESNNHVKPHSDRKTVTFDNAAFQFDK